MLNFRQNLLICSFLTEITELPAGCSSSRRHIFSEWIKAPFQNVQRIPMFYIEIIKVCF